MDYHPPMHGWHEKMLHVDLSTRRTRVEKIPEETLTAYLGGRGLGVALMKDHVHLDPFDSRNAVLDVRIRLLPLRGSG